MGLIWQIIWPYVSAAFAILLVVIIILGFELISSFQPSRIDLSQIVTGTEVAASNFYRGSFRPPADGPPPPTVQAETPGIVGDTILANQLTINLQPGLYEGQGDSIGQQLKGVFEDVQANFDQKVAQVIGATPQPIPPIEVRMIREESCALAGSTYDEAYVVLVYTCNDINSAHAINILAHEFIHQIAYVNFGPRAGRSDLMLVEGLATYGAGHYWLNGYASFRDLVRDQRAGGIAYGLSESYLNRDASAMDAIYYQWASFVEFLLTDPNYGPRFGQLYVTGDNSVASADFQGVYGKSLQELELEWERWLSGP
jgi:hypothetical protein